MRGNNSRVYYYPFSGFAGSILVVYICGRSDSIGRVVYALLLEQLRRAEERRPGLESVCVQTSEIYSQTAE